MTTPTVSFVNYTEVDANNLIGSSPESKTVPTNVPNQAGQSYQQISLSYNYGTPERPLQDVMYLQMPPVTSNGIIESAQNDGKLTYQMYVPLPLSDPEVATFIDKFSAVYHRTADILIQYRGPARIPAPTVEVLLMSGLYKNPLYYPKDKNTNEIIPGRSPSIYLKLIKKGAGPYEEKTLFTDLKGNPIDWKLLYGVDMKCIPLISLPTIYIGNKPSLQVKLVSVIVLEVHPRGSQTRQKDTISDFVNRNPDAVNRLEAQISKLTTERQNLGPPEATPKATPQPFQPPQQFQQFPPPPAIPQLQSISGSYPQTQTPVQSSLQHFLTKAQNVPTSYAQPQTFTTAGSSSTVPTNNFAHPNMVLK